MSLRPGLTIVAAIALILAARAPTIEAEQMPFGMLRAAPASQGCDVDARAVDFGEYEPSSSSPRDVHSQAISYDCWGSRLDFVRIEISRGRAGSYSPRAMFSGSSRLEYNLYLDSNRTTIWGDRSSGTDRYYDGHPPSDKTVYLTVYGRIFALQNVATGTYTDSLIVTLEF